MRDPVLERQPMAWAWHQRYRERGNHRSGRCPVCRVVTGSCRFLAEYSTPAVSPRGREMFVVTCGSHYCRSRAPAFAFWPTDQTTFGPTKGNCFSACTAVLLEMEIKDVPMFMTGDEWWFGYVAWCRARGWQPLFYEVRDPEVGGWVPPGFSIATGPTHRSRALHSCVAYDGRVVHDPNWSRAELLKIVDYVVLLSTDTDEGKRHADRYDKLIADAAKDKEQPA